MLGDSQVQTVPRFLLETKLNRKLVLHEMFTTDTGSWEVVRVLNETYTVQKL